jgi:hypothetical protein
MDSTPDATHISSDQPGRRRTRRAPRTRSVLLATGLAAVVISPLAVARTGGVLREGKRNGTTSVETEIVGNIRSTNALKGGYVTRQSNLSPDGGGAVYGCRSQAGGSAAKPLPQNPCLRANNLSKGLAFEFNAANGDVAGLFTVGAGGDSKKPFTTNATGVATGLNSDELDNLDASEIIAAARAKANLDADKVDGADASDLKLRWALVDEDGNISEQSGGFTVVSKPGINGQPATNPNIYISAGSSLVGKGLSVSTAIQNRIDRTGDGAADAAFDGDTAIGRCNSAAIACAPAGTENDATLVVRSLVDNADVASATRRFYVEVSE